MRLLVALLFAIFAVGQSQSPTATPTATAHANQNKAHLKKQQASLNDKSTQDLFTAINQLTAAVEARNQQELSTQANKKSSTDRWSLANAVLISIFTGVLAVVAGLQFWAMHRQANIAQVLMELADKQTKIAEDQLSLAKASQAIQDLDRSTADERYAEQLALAQENAATAKQSADALVGAQTAWIVVELRWPQGVGRVSYNIQDDVMTTGVFIDLICHNKGQTLAWVMEKRITMALVEKIPPEPDLDAAPLIAAEPEVFGPNWATSTGDQYLACQGTREGKVIIVYGVVRYFDIFEQKRETTFGYELTSVSPPTLERIPIRAYNRNT
jgi:cell division protein FtsL